MKKFYLISVLLTVSHFIYSQCNLSDINLPKDTIICTERSFGLSAKLVGGKKYEWHDGSDSSFYLVGPQIEGKFWVKVSTSDPNCFKTDSIVIKRYTIKPLDLEKDTVLCMLEGFKLDAGEGYHSYQWSPSNQMERIVYPKTFGKWSVKVLDFNGCTQIDSINLIHYGSKNNLKEESHPEEAPVDICNDSTATLEVSHDREFSPIKSLIWYPTLETTKKITVRTSGKYYYEIKDSNNCLYSDTIHVKFLPPSPKPFLGNDTSICANANFSFSFTGFNQYQWHNSSSQNTYALKSTDTLIWVKASVFREGTECFYSDTIKINRLPEISSECGQTNGISDNENHQVKVFPNPVSDFINIDIQNLSNSRVSIFSLTGTLIYTEETRNINSYTLDLGFLNEGMYILEIRGKEIFTHRRFQKIKN